MFTRSHPLYAHALRRYKMLTLTKGLTEAIAKEVLAKAAHDVSREARLPKGAKGGGEFTRTGASAAPTDEPASANSPHPNAKPPKGLHALPLKDIRLDAERFQFRQDVNPDNGTDDRLAGVEKYDPFLAGIISVWRDTKAKGEPVYVCDGHHRYSLAKRLRVRDVNVQFIPANTAQEAMVTAGLKNLAEGHATALDAARLLRVNKIGEKAMRKANVALTGTLASKALALSTLAETVYQDVLSGRMDEGRGVAIAQAFPSEPAQVAVRDMLSRPEYRRKRLSDADIRELSHFVSTAGKQTKTIHTLFGDESLVQSLAVEKAQISAGVKAKLKADKTLFGFVAKTSRAEALKRGNNVIDTAASGTIHNEATRMLEMYDRLSGYAGPVSSVLNAAAKQFASGGEKNAIVNGVYGEIRRILGEEPLGATPAAAGQSGAGRGSLDPAGSGLESQPVEDGGLFRAVCLTPTFTPVLTPTFIPPNPLAKATPAGMQRQHKARTRKPVRTGGLAGITTGLFKGVKLAVLFTSQTLEKCCGKGKDCDGSGSKGKPNNNLSQLVRDAHHTNKHVVADACDHENAEKVLIAGEGKAKYPATHCKRCGRIALDDKKHHKLASHKVPMPVLMKAVASNCYKNPGNCDLRWITAHPNGEEPGVPLLVHDNGEEYTVVGGAGGKMNHMVLRKPKEGDKDKAKEAKDAKQAARLKRTDARLASLGAGAMEARDKAAMLRDRAAKSISSTENTILKAALKHLGIDGADVNDIAENAKVAWKGGKQGDTGSVFAQIKKQAAERAEKEFDAHRQGAGDEQSAGDETLDSKTRDEFVNKVATAAVQEVKSAVKQAGRQLLDHDALRQLGDKIADVKPAQAVVMLNGKKVTLDIPPEDAKERVRALVSAAADRASAKAIERAMNSGNKNALQGLMADTAPLSDEEADAQNLTKYLDGQEVNANTALVKGSEMASEGAQRRNQANGACDAVNAICAAATGSAILNPGLAKTLGVENTARVAAAYLVHHGMEGRGTAEAIRTHLVSTQYAAADNANKAGDELDQQTKFFQDAAAEGDGSITQAQAISQAAQNSLEKFRILNTARGQLRGTQALAQSLARPDKSPLVLPAGDTLVGARSFADGLGLNAAHYTVSKSDTGTGGGYQVSLPAEHIHTLAHAVPVANTDRNTELDGLKQDVAQNAGQWQPEGFNNADIHLRPYQELAARAIAEQKHMMVSYGAGTGKTSVIYSAAAHLISSGKVDKVLVTMPKGPRGQQARDHYAEADYDARGNLKPDAKIKPAEKNKFLGPELRDKVAVCEGRADIVKALAGVKDGSIKILVLSNEGMRDNLHLLKEAGFGGDRSMYFGDEAHTLAPAGKSEGGAASSKEAGWTGAAREMCRSEYAALATGSFLRNSPNDFYALHEMIHPGALGKKKEFVGEFERLSQSQGGLTDIATQAMRDRVGGGMVSYDSAPTNNGEPLTLNREDVTVPAAPEQKAAIAKLQEVYRREKISTNPKTRTSAVFKFQAAMDKVLSVGVKGEDGKVINPKLDKITEIMAEEKTKNPDSRLGIFHYNKEPLVAARVRLKDKKLVKIDGDNDDKKTSVAINAVNEKGNGVDGITLGKNAMAGVNLQGLSTIVNMAIPTSASDAGQVEKRHFRMGADEDKRMVQVVSDNPYEQKRLHTLRTKKQRYLSTLASLADPTGAANVLGNNLAALKAAAAG